MRSLRFAVGLAAVLGCRSPTAADADERAAATPSDTPQGRTIAGTVQALDRPLANARVCAHRLTSSAVLVSAELEPTCAQTDAAGHFTLSVGSGVFVVVAAADRHLPTREQVMVRAGEPDASVLLELHPGGRLYGGTVLDIDGQPIPGATVSHEFDDLEAPVAVETRTDAQGRFSLWSARGGELSTRAPGHSRVAIASRDQRRLVLLPESSIRGVVVDRDGNPVAHARVSSDGWMDDTVRTDAHGHFRLAQLEPGEHTITATAESLGGELEVALGFAEQLEGVVLTLDRALAQHRALIVDVETGAPVAGCELEMRRPDDWSTVTGWTDENGLFELPLDREHRLTTIRCPGYVASQPFRRIGPDLPAPTRIEVRRGTTLDGKVFDESDQPVVGLAVELLPKYWADHGTYWPARAVTDANGRFTITGLPGNEFRLTNHRPAGEPTVVMTYARSTVDYTFEIRSTGRVEIEVGTNGIGRAVWLLVCKNEAADEFRMSEVESDRLAVFEHVLPGAYALDFASLPWEHTACSNPDSPQINVAARATTRLRIDAGPLPIETIVVRVLDQEGAPVSGAVVTHTEGRRPIGAHEWDLEELVLTDAEGRAELPFDPELAMVVMAARPGLYGAKRVKRSNGRAEVIVRLESSR